MSYLNVMPVKSLVIFMIFTKSVAKTTAGNAAQNFVTQTRIVFSTFAFYIYALHKISLKNILGMFKTSSFCLWKGESF